MKCSKIKQSLSIDLRRYGIKSSVPVLTAKRTIGVIGAGRGVGVTHFAITTSGYLSGIQRHSTCFLEWNGHGDFERLKSVCLEGTETSPFRILDVDYYDQAGTEALMLCKTKGYQEVIVDYGAVNDGSLDQFLRCDRQFVLGSVSEWQIKAFLDFAGQWKKGHRSWDTLVVFGSEESRKNLEKRLGFIVRRIPVSADAFTFTGEMIQFYQAILG